MAGMTPQDKAFEAPDVALDDELDALFDAARAEAPLPGADLIARVLADADRLQPAPRPLAPARVAQGGRAGETGAGGGFWHWLAGGGMFAGLGSLAAACGLALGLVQPAALVSVQEALAFGTGSTTQIDLMPGIDALLSEE